MKKKDQRLLLGGILLGAAAGYYLNSKNGRKMRSQIVETTTETLDTVKQKSNVYANQLNEKGSVWKDTLTSKAVSAKETLAEKARMARESIANYTPGNNDTESIMDRIENGIEETAQRLEINNNSIV